MQCLSIKHIATICMGIGIRSAVEVHDPIASERNAMTSHPQPKSAKPTHEAPRFSRAPRVAVRRINTTKAKKADVRSGSHGMRQAAKLTARTAIAPISPIRDTRRRSMS
jgi:hypothetical protein